MKKIKITLYLISVTLFAGLLFASPQTACADHKGVRYLIVASDTLLSDMAGMLLPANRFSVEAILPPGQCPGHYDVKLSDIEKIRKADLVIFFRNMPFMEKSQNRGQSMLAMDSESRNWMAPDSYLFGLNRLAVELARRFPEERNGIFKRKENAVRLVRDEAKKLRRQAAGITGRAVLASSQQKETLEWMGLRVAGVYGRPESLSAKDVVRLLKIGKVQQISAVIDNLQSGPDAGKSIAETLGKPHVVLNNFPSERGYLATLQDNVHMVLAALERR